MHRSATTSSGMRAAARSGASSFRQPRLQHAARRFESATSAATPAPTTQSHMLAGLGGGAVVLAGVYGYYRYSGISTVVDQGKNISQGFQQLKGKASDATPDVDSMLRLVRQAAHSYAAAIPGGAMVIDRAFDAVQEAAKDHGPAVSKMLQETYEELSDAMSSAENAPEKMLALVTKKLKEFQSFANDQIQPLLESNPQLKEALEKPLAQLQDLAHQHGPKAEELYRKTASDLQKLASKGLNPSSLAEASSLVTSRLAEIRELAQETGGDVWAKATAAAGPLMAKMPDVGKGFEKQIGSLKDAVGGEGADIVEDAYKQLAEIAEKAGAKGGNAKDSLKKAQKVVEDTVAKLTALAQKKGPELASKASGNASSLLKHIPGFENIPELGQLSELAGKRGPEAKKLLESTAEEIQKILRKKLDEAKGLGEKTAKDVKQ